MRFLSGRLPAVCFASGLVFSVGLGVFWTSPVYYMSDSNYSILLSQSLLDHGSFALDHYAIPRLPPIQRAGWHSNGDLYQLELVNNRLYYFFPPGSSILSLPYVALMRAFGLSVVNADGTHNLQNELMIQTSLAALLMAGLATVFLLTSALVLPLGWSVLIALSGAFGTQVWSTASRGLGADTWGIVLLGLVIFIILAHEAGKGHIKPLVFASLLSWMYFVRPTASVHILAITIYLLLFHRQGFFWYAITGVTWFALFVAYSWYHFGQLLPTYYLASRLTFSTFWTALAGHLVSPSRGLLVYVPVLLFVAYLLVRYWKELPFPRLATLSLTVIAGHLVVHSMFSPWYGGGCYGPRYSTGLVPWFVLLGILGTSAMLRWDETHQPNGSSLYRSPPLILGALLLALSVWIHARGALAHETLEWNLNPGNIDEQPERIWDWRQPQFLSGWVPTPLPQEFPLAETVIDMMTVESNRYLLRGWDQPEPPNRWTYGKRAIIVFGLKEVSDTVLHMKLQPFVVPGKHAEQRVEFELNRHYLTTLVLRRPEAQIHSITLPSHMLRETNVLTLGLPDAIPPQVLKVNRDSRPLAISLQWMQWARQPWMGALPVPPLPQEFPLAQQRIDLTAPEADRYLVQGWSAPEPPFRWSEGERATVVFALNEVGDTVLHMILQPFVVPGKHEEQRVTVELNGQRLTTLTLSLKDAGLKKYSLFLPRQLVREKNVLMFGLPDAIAPNALAISSDPRLLGVSLQAIEFEPQVINP
jgi:hypothetical protein